MFAAKNEFFSPQQGYQISRSARFRNSAGAYITRPFATPTNSSKWTMSMWVKRGLISSSAIPALFGKTVSAGANFYLAYEPAADGLTWTFTNALYMTSTAVFRDPSAWYHVVAVWDSANATASLRARLFVNGVELTSFTPDNRSSITTSMDAWNTTNTAYLHGIGGASASVSTLTQFFDGEITEINFIDGQALTASSFGKTNPVTGVWQPIKYTGGGYGNNGFYINFSDNSAATAAALGKDYSGNGNNWTPNNISLTAGVTYDSMLDVPTPYGDGGNGRGNYCVLNPLQPSSTTSVVPVDGNLKMTGTASGNNVTGTMTIPANSYFEGTVITGGGTVQFGVRNLSTSNTYVYDSSGNKVLAGTSTAYGASFTTNDVIGVAVDPVNLTLQFFKNGTSQGTITSAFPSGDYVPFFYASNTNSSAANFGQRPFSYTPPSGFVALNTQNLPAAPINNGANYMAATTYTGTGVARSITNGGNNPAGITFQPDLVWGKSRSAATNNSVFDSVRGVTKGLVTNTTSAEATSATTLTAFNADGFSYGTNTVLNTNAATYVAWQWQAGKGSTSSNTSGSITSTVSVSATAGFSIVTYTGTGANATVGHGLGVAPSLIIIKRTNVTSSWAVYHTSLGGTKYALLNGTGGAVTSATYWNNTAPTSSVFTVSTATDVNANTGTYVAYCWSAVAGYSSFGTYTGNGSTDGPFVFTGFRPRFIMTKRTDTTSDWRIIDTSRDTYNVASAQLYPDLANAEALANMLDVLSNGFKLRNTDTGYNASAGSYIYVAYAENPLKIALAR